MVKRKNSKVPVVILNGFLGAGKTTLFRNLLAQSNRKNINVCAIVNDMSELDVDGELLGTSEIIEENEGILESISSCVLSSTKGLIALDKAIHKLFSTQDPEILLIETSGSGHPMPLITYFKDHNECELTGVFVLVDCLSLAHDFNYGESLITKLQQNLANNYRDTINLLVEQVLFSSHVLLTKTDRIHEDKVPLIASYLNDINPFASTHAVRYGNLEIDSLLDLGSYDYFQVAQLVEELQPVLSAEEENNSPYNITTRIIKDERPFHPKRLWDTCHQYLDTGIYRSKGFFWLASRDKHSLLWNQAGGSISLEIIGTWQTGIVEDDSHGLTEIEINFLKERLSKIDGRFGDRRCDLTVIGDRTKVDVFTNALKDCFLTEDEIDLYENGHHFEDPWPKNLVKMVN